MNKYSGGQTIQNKTRRAWTIAAFAAVFMISALRFLYYGLYYPHMLDDYIQYHNYAAFSESKLYLLLNSGLLGARPLAGAADLYVWSGFYGNMAAAVIIISLLYAAALLLLYKVFSRRFGVSFFIVLLCLLLPSGLEGIYWVSASSRIAVGLFFLSLSAFLLDRYLESGQKRYAIAAYLFQFVCFCFYEPVMLLSIVMSVILIAVNRTPVRKFAVLTAITLSLAAAYFIFTGFFIGGGVYSGRAQIILPTSAYYWDNFLPRVLGMLKKAYISAPVLITGKGFIRGVKILLEDRAVLYAVFILLSSAAAFFIMKNTGTPGDGSKPAKRLVPQLIAGLLLAAAPASIHFVMPNPFVPLRGTVLSYPGFALMLDALASLVLRRRWESKAAVLSRAAAASLCVAVFLTAGVSELHDYRQTEKDDLYVMERLYPLVKDNREDEKITVLGIRKSYLEDQNYFVANHIHGVTESDWSLTGAMRAVYDSPMLPYVIPLEQDTVIYVPERIEGSKDYYVWDDSGEIVRVECEKTGEGYNFYDESGELRAEIINHSGVNWLSIY